MIVSLWGHWWGFSLKTWHLFLSVTSMGYYPFFMSLNVFYIINQLFSKIKETPLKSKIKDIPAYLHICDSTTFSQAINRRLSWFYAKRPPPPSRTPVGPTLRTMAVKATLTTNHKPWINIFSSEGFERCAPEQSRWKHVQCGPTCVCWPLSGPSEYRTPNNPDPN